ncbi:EamA family transporter RarD [Pseudomonas neustonica]|uniref:EamA family transporter RarD n=1 Tax=Pseudomonas neustonica TaxID=2487346 RepID=A0ABX9XH02_9PSED|nr:MULTISPECIES: EamA family transporter RarD [Pseudomonas]ROZ82235.1 EamA family transporter RarD [Pseudomonas sp. SSM44]ROZ84033.1 EamA family transporter RarD [Pseudomonas neustonica]
MAIKLDENSQGIAYGVSAYMLWGCFPLFFALFDGVPAYEILVHRIIWSCVFLTLLITLMRRWAPVVNALAHPGRLGRVAGCAVLIALNWGVYIYSVETHHVLQASLGYFLTPLINVALGMLILRERMARLQGVAVALAVVGILVQLVLLGTIPWIAVILALSFGTYGLLRKQVLLDGLSGLFVETLLLLPLALLALAAMAQLELSHFTQDARTLMLLLASGVFTAVPLLAFAGAARRLRLATLGFLMYINPSMQFLIAVFAFKEAISSVQLASFALIWLALLLYSWSAWRGMQSARKQQRV